MRLVAASLVCGALLALTAGCQTQPGQAENPFLRSTVPPPGSFTQPPPGAVQATPAPVPPPTATPAPGNPYSPSSGFNFNGSSLERRRHRRPGPALAAHNVQYGDFADESGYEADEVELAEEEGDEPIHVLAAAYDDSVALGDNELAPAPPPETPTVVKVLSPSPATLARQERAPTPAGKPTPAPSAVELASYDEPTDASQGVEPAAAEHVAVAVAEPPGRFSHADDYSLLEGRLEYSQKSKLWKLRYIPLDGQADDFGGSVVLRGELTVDYQEGDFVVVRGRPGSSPALARSFAPSYELTSIVKQ